MNCILRYIACSNCNRISHVSKASITRLEPFVKFKTSIETGVNIKLKSITCLIS
jgi:hypothetical protein